MEKIKNRVSVKYLKKKKEIKSLETNLAAMRTKIKEGRQEENLNKKLEGL